MTIRSSLPSNVRKPGVYHEFDWSAAGQALVPLDRRVVILAEKSSAGTATANTPVQLFGAVDGDEKCGLGSLAALMNRQALLQAVLSGFGAPEIWACPLDENAGGTASQHTITITGPATASKDLILKLAGRLISVGVTSGDTATVVALAVKNKLDELAATLPFTAGVAAGVVTVTWRTKGVNGNDLARTTVQLVAGLTVAYAASVPGVGATAITTALAALYDRRYHAIVLSNHAVADATVLLADAAFSWGFGVKSFRHYAMGERGSLGTAQTLQAGFNDHRFIITSCENSGSLPGEIAISQMVAWYAREAPNANLDDERLGLDPCDAASVYSDAEIESALATGVTPLVPDGVFLKIVRQVTTQITVSAAPFEPLREPALSRTGAFMAEQIDIGLRIGLHQETMWQDPAGGDDIFKRARDIIVGRHRAAERLRILTDVESFLPEIKVEAHPTLAGRLLAQDPMAVAGPHHQTALNHIMYLR